LNGRAREPVLNAPMPAVLIALSIVGLYWLQSQVPDQNAFIIEWGLIPQQVEAGRYEGLFTSLLLHGGWPHALMNGAFALALGAPVARLLGARFRHAVAFLLFYVFCGVAANVIYVVLHPGGPQVLIGASGAVSGLMGAAARLLNTRGVLGPVLSRTVFSFAAAWIVLNLILAVIGFAPGLGNAAIAWEAHLAGFFVGLLLIGPWAAWFGQRSIQAAEAEGSLDSPPRGPWAAANTSVPAWEPPVEEPPAPAPAAPVDEPSPPEPPPEGPPPEPQDDNRVN